MLVPDGAAVGAAAAKPSDGDGSDARPWHAALVVRALCEGAEDAAVQVVVAAPWFVDLSRL